MEDNVQWVCAWVNIMKGGMNELDFFSCCQHVVGAFPHWQSQQVLHQAFTPNQILSVTNTIISLKQGKAPPVYHLLTPPPTPVQAIPELATQVCNSV
jgi:hypothetical protein